jgi:hypothetical protein
MGDSDGAAKYEEVRTMSEKNLKKIIFSDTVSPNKPLGRPLRCPRQTRSGYVNSWAKRSRRSTGRVTSR